MYARYLKFMVGCLCCLLPLFSAAQEVNPLVTFKGTEVPLNKALLDLRKAHDVSLAYDSRELKRFTVSDDGSERRLHTLLDLWLEPIGFTYEVVGTTTVIRNAQRIERKLATSSQPQKVTLYGQLIDRESMEPLPFGSVTLVTSGKGANANEDGYFALTEVLSDTASVRVSYVGYLPRVLTVADFMQQSPLIVSLVRSRSLLPVARVQTQRDSRLITSQRPSLQSVDTELAYRLPNAGEPDIVRTMQLLPGVSGALENSAALHIRGGAADENLVTYDGFTVYYLDHFYGVFSAFNANSVQNIRLHKGVFDVRYGGRTSSVMEVTGKSGNRYRTVVKTDLTLLSAAMHVETPVLGDKTSFTFSARRSFTDFVFSPTYRNIFDGIYTDNVNAQSTFGGDSDPDFHFYDLTSKISYRSEKGDDLSLSVYSGRDELAIGYTEETLDDRFQIEYNDQSRWGTNGIGGRWSRQWNSAEHTTVTLGWSTFNSELFGFDSRSNLLVGIEDTLFFDRNTSINDLTLRAVHDISYEKHDLAFGADVTALVVENGRITSEGGRVNSRSEEQVIAVHAGDRFRPVDRFEIHPGLRSSYFTGTDRFYHEPRLMLAYEVLPKLTLHGAAGRSYQFIRNVRRQDLFLNTSDEWRIAGDASVPVAQSDQVSAGFSLDLKPFRLEIEAYAREMQGSIEDALRFISIAPGTFPDDLVNGSGRARGIEALVSKSEGVHTGWVAYTLSQVRNQFDALSIDEVPAYFDRLHELKAVYSFRPGRLEFNAIFVYASGLPFTPATGVYDLELINDEAEQLLAFSEIYSARLPAYHRLDLSVHYTFQIRASDASVGFSLYNAYDRNNVRNRYSYLVGTQAEALQVDLRDQLFLGAIPSIQLSIEW
jgi:hypothetical protein